ncbi:Uncharacterised protein [Mycobacteroides abscessus subsp. abscessus]|nr:Uncharacterised protein [Mycobacteroides abscessus subsp. abscessus]
MDIEPPRAIVGMLTGFDPGHDRGPQHACRGVVGVPLEGTGQLHQVGVGDGVAEACGDDESRRCGES